MLNKDDITEICGVITSKEVKEELGLTDAQFRNFIYYGKIFRNKYILIEDDETKNDHEEQLFKTVLVCETDYGKRYYATYDGKFFVTYKNGGTRFLSGYIKEHRGKRNLHVKLGNKDYVAKNLIASLFIDGYKPRDVVLIKSNTISCVGVENLVVIDKAKYSRVTGSMARSEKVGLYENGKLVKTFRSSREAGRKLFCSHQMINNYCNNRTKKKEYDVRWL